MSEVAEANSILCRTCGASLSAGGNFCHVCGSDVGLDGGGRRKPLDVLGIRLAQVVKDRYAIMRTLGAGGMGAVFLANDRKLEREVAIKVLPADLSDDDDVAERFRNEARTVAKLDHPNIVAIYGVEQEGGLHYIVMKYVSGGSLDTYLQSRGGVLPIHEAVRLLAEVARGLGHAHRRGIVHRDMKPANILIDADGRALVADFGISKAVQQVHAGVTRTGMIVGTPHYMSPEQIDGTLVDGRSDQYSLAIVAYQVLTGSVPFDAETYAGLLSRQLHDPPPPMLGRRADLPPATQAVVMQALAKKREERFASMEDFASALEHSLNPTMERPIVAGLRESATPTLQLDRATLAQPAPAALARGRRPWLVPAGLAAAAAVGVLVLRGRAEPPAVPARDSVSVAAPVSATPPAPAPDAPTAPPDSARTQVERLAENTAPVEPPRPRPRPQPIPAETVPLAVARPVAPAPVPQATLTVETDPWGEVFVDDRDLGPTPLAGVPLTLGKHELRVEREGFKPKRETISVTSPNPIRRKYVLEDAAP